MIITKNGITIRLAVDELRVMGRATQGVKLIRLLEDDEIASVAKIEESILAMSQNLNDVETLDVQEIDTINEPMEDGIDQTKTDQASEPENDDQPTT